MDEDVLCDMVFGHHDCDPPVQYPIVQ
jgi:hypothetical protein